MNAIMKSNVQNRNLINQNKINFRQLKDYYKSKTNLHNYLIINKCEQFLENFELLDYINSGSSGVVYKGCVKNNPTDKVCLKFLLNKTETEKITKQNNNKIGDKNINNDAIIEEINIQKKLQYKNIVKYYDYFDLKGYGCIVMELADSGDIAMISRRITDKKNLSETFLAFITKQILEGLYFIHNNKIIHMDIKQQNILIDNNLAVKITDFFFFFSYDKIKSHEKIKLPFAGTNPYMSPEVLKKAYIDIEDASKIDMFSLGVMLYNLSIGDFPYKLNENAKKILMRFMKKFKRMNLNFPKIKTIQKNIHIYSLNF